MSDGQNQEITFPSFNESAGSQLETVSTYGLRIDETGVWEQRDGEEPRRLSYDNPDATEVWAEDYAPEMEQYRDTHLPLIDPTHRLWKITCDWQGCCTLHRAFNGYFGMDDYDEVENADRIHICDIDDLIDRLQAAKKRAHAHFKNKYWNE